MKSLKKVNIVVEGIKMSIPVEAIKYRNDGVTPYVYGKGPIASSIVKQYVKSKYPKVVCTVKSSSFANGSSLDVYLSNPDGSSIDEVIYDDVDSFSGNFEYGRFCSYNDMYEVTDSSPLFTESGTQIDPAVKYVHTNNKPAFGSVGDCVRMLRDMVDGKYVWGPISMENAIGKIMDYNISRSTIDKALVYIK